MTNLHGAFHGATSERPWRSHGASMAQAGSEIGCGGRAATCTMKNPFVEGDFSWWKEVATHPRPKQFHGASHGAVMAQRSRHAEILGAISRPDGSSPIRTARGPAFPGGRQKYFFNHNEDRPPNRHISAAN
jgi:hypothetical protein